MKIVVVGNGAGSLKRQSGRFIDSSDLVIRINDYQTDGFEEAIGSRTDVHMLNSWAKVPALEATRVAALSEVWFAFPDPSTWGAVSVPRNSYDAEYLNRWRTDLSAEESDVDAHGAAVRQFIPTVKRRYFDASNVLALVAALKLEGSKLMVGTDGKLVQPTTGAKSIWFAKALYPDAEIFITGFDGFQLSTYYWKPSMPDQYDNHAYVLELEWLDMLSRSREISRLD